MTPGELLILLEDNDLYTNKETTDDEQSAIRLAEIKGYVSAVRKGRYTITEKGLDYLFDLRQKKNQDEKYPQNNPIKYANPNLEVNTSRRSINTSWMLKHIWIIVSAVIASVVAGVILKYL